MGTHLRKDSMRGPNIGRGLAGHKAGRLGSSHSGELERYDTTETGESHGQEPHL